MEASQETEKSPFERRSNEKNKNTYLVTVFAFAVEFEVLAHFSSELVDVWGAWSEVVVDAAQGVQTRHQRRTRWSHCWSWLSWSRWWLEVWSSHGTWHEWLGERWVEGCGWYEGWSGHLVFVHLEWLDALRIEGSSSRCSMGWLGAHWFEKLVGGVIRLVVVLVTDSGLGFIVGVLIWVSWKIERISLLGLSHNAAFEFLVVVAR